MNAIQMIFIGILAIAILILVLLSIKKGIWSGVRVFITTILSILMTSVIHTFFGAIVADNLLSVEMNVIDWLYAAGLSGLTVNRVISDTLLNITSYIVAPFICILLFVIFYIIIGIVMRIKKFRFITTDKKLIGFLCGIISSLMIVVSALFLPNMNIYHESEGILRLLDVTLDVVAEKSTEPILRDADSIVKIYFDTDLIVATSEERLALLNRMIIHIANDNGISKEDAEKFAFTSQEQLTKELPHLINIYTTMYGYSPAVPAMSGNMTTQYIEQLSKDIYSTHVYEFIVRSVLEQMVRTVTGNNSFQYPKQVDLSDSEEEFAKLLTYLTVLYDGGEIDSVTLIELKNSPLIPVEVFTELLKYVE